MNPVLKHCAASKQQREKKTRQIAATVVWHDTRSLESRYTGTDGRCVDGRRRRTDTPHHGSKKTRPTTLLVQHELKRMAGCFFLNRSTWRRRWPSSDFVVSVPRCGGRLKMNTQRNEKPPDEYHRWGTVCELWQSCGKKQIPLLHYHFLRETQLHFTERNNYTFKIQ